MEQENCKDVHRKQNNISILTIISAVCSGRPVEIGPGWAGEGERAAKVRAGGRHSHLKWLSLLPVLLNNTILMQIVKMR